MQYVIPVIGFLVGFAPGLLMGRRRMHLALWGLVALLVVAAGYMIRAGRAQGDGWEAIGFGIVAFLMIAPAVAGLVAGGLTGLYGGRKTGQTTAHDDASRDTGPTDPRP